MSDDEFEYDLELDFPDEEDNRRTETRRKFDRRGSEIKNRVVDQGKYVFRECETGDLAFVIVKGKIEITRSTDQGDLVLNIIGKGTIFGEMALIDNMPRMASARVVEGPAELLVISRDVFRMKMDTMDIFTQALVNILTSHIRSLADQINLLKKAS